jgi:hypothetical protein
MGCQTDYPGRLLLLQQFPYSSPLLATILPFKKKAAGN